MDVGGLFGYGGPNRYQPIWDVQIETYRLQDSVAFSDGFRLSLCYNTSRQCANPVHYFCR